MDIQQLAMVLQVAIQVVMGAIEADMAVTQVEDMAAIQVVDMAVMEVEDMVEIVGDIRVAAMVVVVVTEEEDMVAVMEEAAMALQQAWVPSAVVMVEAASVDLEVLTATRKKVPTLVHCS